MQTVTVFYVRWLKGVAIAGSVGLNVKMNILKGTNNAKTHSSKTDTEQTQGESKEGP